MPWIALAILLVILLVVLISCIVIVPQSNAYVIEWLGVYKATWEAGLHLKVPFLERVARRVSLKEEVADFTPQPVITRDNVTMMIDTVVFSRYLMQSCMRTASTARFRRLRICPPRRCAISSVRCPWMKR